MQTHKVNYMRRKKYHIERKQLYSAYITSTHKQKNTPTHPTFTWKDKIGIQGKTFVKIIIHQKKEKEKKNHNRYNNNNFSYSLSMYDPPGQACSHDRFVFWGGSSEPPKKWIFWTPKVDFLNLTPLTPLQNPHFRPILWLKVDLWQIVWGCTPLATDRLLPARLWIKSYVTNG